MPGKLHPTSPMNKKSCSTIVPQGATQAKPPQQLCLPLEMPQKKPEGFALQKRQKPQISSIPGISPRIRNRYRVVLGDEVLGTELDLDAALQLADSTKAVNFSNNLKSR